MQREDVGTQGGPHGVGGLDTAGGTVECGPLRGGGGEGGAAGGGLGGVGGRSHDGDGFHHHVGIMPAPQDVVPRTGFQEELLPAIGVTEEGVGEVIGDGGLGVGEIGVEVSFNILGGFVEVRVKVTPLIGNQSARLVHREVVELGDCFLCLSAGAALDKHVAQGGVGEFVSHEVGTFRKDTVVVHEFGDHT